MEEIKRELIKKHLEDWDGLKKSSIEHFAQSGKVSGSFFTALKDMLDEYAEQLRIHDVVERSEQLVCPNCDGEGFSGKGTNEILPCLSCFGSGERAA